LIWPFGHTEKEMKRKDVFLRTLLNTDAPAMLEWMHNPEVQKSFGKNFNSMTIEDCQRFIKLNQMLETDDVNFAISSEDNKYVGTVSLKHVDHKTKSAEFAIVVHPDYHRQGVASQAMAQIAKYGFKVMGLECIFLNVKKSNVAANRTYQKFGCVETTEKELRDKGIRLHLPETDEEMNWYIVPTG